MDLRTQLATRFHIENIRELLHYIKEDERLREEIYRPADLWWGWHRLLSGIVGLYPLLKTWGRVADSETRRTDRRGTYLPAFGKTKDVAEPAMPTTASWPSTSGLTGFLYGTDGIKTRTGRSAVSLHQTCLSTDLLHPRTTARIAHYAGDNGTGIVGSCHTFSKKKHIESYQSKEKERTSELIIYSDGISGKYLWRKSVYRCKR